jgi:hypothetical protein
MRNNECKHTVWTGGKTTTAITRMEELGGCGLTYELCSGSQLSRRLSECEVCMHRVRLAGPEERSTAGNGMAANLSSLTVSVSSHRSMNKQTKYYY